MWGNSGVKLASTNYNAQLTNYKNKTLNNSNSNNFDYNTRLSFNQTYDKKVEILQNRLVELGYLDMSAGWNSKLGDLAIKCQGKMLFGGIYLNRDKHLPSSPNRIWYEADINYNNGYRGTERILFSNDGLIFVTYDHYETFIEIK